MANSTAPHAYSAAAEAYLTEQLRLSRFWGFLLSGSLALRDVIQFAIENTDSPAEANQRLRDQFGLRPGEELRRHDVDYGVHRDLIAEVMLCRLVDNFLTYFVELLALIYARRPEMLRSGEQVNVDFVLQHDNITALRRAIAERRVEKLAYLGMRDLVKNVREQHGFDAIPEQEHLAQAVLLVEMRNLIVHNRGIVNKIAVAKAPQLREATGVRIPLHEDDVRKYRAFLDDRVTDIDVRAVAKFDLNTDPSSGAA